MLEIIKDNDLIFPFHETASLTKCLNMISIEIDALVVNAIDDKNVFGIVHIAVICLNDSLDE
jgi:hypothetical protein